MKVKVLVAQLYPPSLFPGSDLYGHALALPFGRPAIPVRGPGCPGPGMLHLQASMHFPGEGTEREVGAGHRFISAGWSGLRVGCRSVPRILRSLASNLLLYSAGAHCPSLFLGDTDHSPTGS